MAGEFFGKVVIITGASSGLGQATAVMMAEKGASICLSGRDEKRLKAVADECSKISRRSVDDSFFIVVGDVSVEDTRKHIVEKTVAKFGHLDILVNNAGISLPDGGIEETIEKTFDLIIDVNLKSAFFLSQMVIPYLKESGGCIVNMSSMFSVIAGPKVIVYAMSKAAMDHMTRCMAIGLAPMGIRVNAVNPSFIPGTAITREFPDTEKGDAQMLYTQYQMGKQPLNGTCGTAEDIANSVSFLASNKARFITGQCHQVDGGRFFMGTD